MTQTIIDVPTFTALKEAMGDDFFDELLSTYFEETEGLLDTLQQSLTSMDCDSFQRAAHSIKSTSNSFGALQFGLLARELEMMGKSGNINGAQSNIDLLKTGFVEVKQTLEGMGHDK